MARPRVHAHRVLTATERAQRSRAFRRRLEVLLDTTSFDQIEGFAQRWKCARQEVLKIGFSACLPAMRKSHSAQDLFNIVRDALERLGIE